MGGLEQVFLHFGYSGIETRRREPVSHEFGGPARRQQAEQLQLGQSGRGRGTGSYAWRPVRPVMVRYDTMYGARYGLRVFILFASASLRNFSSVGSNASLRPRR